MRKFYLYFNFVLIFQFQNAVSQVTLNADGPGNTYELINSVFAPGFDVIEAPDCNHTGFGRHIDEIFDAELSTNVFRFFIHVTPDNDRCINFDRQRNEIKTYDKSPDNLKGIEGETVIYKWKFKIDAGFQSSSNFTHLHQLKSVGGTLESMPMYTLTTRKGTPNQLELRYAETDTQITLKKTDLTAFKGIWLDVTETIKYGISGTYSIEINQESNGATLFSYSNNSIINWRAGADFVRPKWGIYRSLNSPSDLRDETVLFANFSIDESTLSVNKSESKNLITIYPNPANDILNLKNTRNNVNLIQIFNIDGRKVLEKTINITDTDIKLDVSSISNGAYIVNLSKNGQNKQTQILIVSH